MSLQFELVLPCYNEEKSLEAIVQKAIAAAEAQKFSAQQFGLVLVENGSQDNSRHLLQTMKSNERYSSWIRVVSINSNEGYGNGVWLGLKSTTAEYVGWSHSDQQCDPADAFRALQILRSQPLKHGVLVKGIRHGRSLQEKFVSRVFEALAWLILGHKIYEINAQPKVFHRSLLSSIKNPPKDFAFDLYVLYTALVKGWHICTIDVRFPPRVHGLSNWAHSLKSRRRTILNMIKYMFVLRKQKALSVAS